MHYGIVLKWLNGQDINSWEVIQSHVCVCACR